MNLFVLDTDILTLHEKGHVQVRARIDAEPGDDIAITVITVEEQLSGWYSRMRKAKKPNELAEAYQGLARAVPLLARRKILEFAEPAIARFKHLRA